MSKSEHIRTIFRNFGCELTQKAQNDKNFDSTPFLSASFLNTFNSMLINEQLDGVVINEALVFQVNQEVTHRPVSQIIFFMDGKGLIDAIAFRFV